MKKVVMGKICLIVAILGGIGFFKSVRQEKMVESTAQIQLSSEGSRERPVSGWDELALTQLDCIHIQELLDPLANWSLIRLGMNQNEVKARGHKIAHVHVLKCLGHIFSDPRLKKLMVKIRKRKTIWKAFSSGFATSLAEFHKRGDIMPYLRDFTSITQTEASVISSCVEQGNWKCFIDNLF